MYRRQSKRFKFGRSAGICKLYIGFHSFDFTDTASRPSFSPLFRFEMAKGLVPTGKRSMRTGFRALRLLQLFWPDPKPRLAFQEQLEKLGAPAEEGLDIVYQDQGLSMSIQEPLALYPPHDS